MQKGQETQTEKYTYSEIKNPDLWTQLAKQEKIIGEQKKEISELHERLQSNELVHEIQIRALEDNILMLRKEAMFDNLTQLYRRNSFEIELEKEISKINLSHSEEQKEHRKGNVLHNMSLIFIDADHFKHINDTYGHEAGDNALKQIADILKISVRKIDFVCRWGGEEMIVALPEADEPKAYEIAEKIRKNIEDETTLTVSMGVASYENGIDGATLINRADYAMYKAKHKKGGRNCVECYSHFTSEDHIRYQPLSKGRVA